MLVHSATEIAKMASLSKETAARFFQHLGYADYHEAKQQARAERDQSEQYRYSVRHSGKVALDRTIVAHLDVELKNLTKTFEEICSDKTNRAAEMIGAAPKVWILGLGNEDGIARFARLAFSPLRHHVMILGSNQCS